MRIGRTGQVSEVVRQLRHTPVVAILGARQVGKTTLAGEVRRVWPSSVTSFEFKRTTTPSATPSMRSALRDLGLSSIEVIHAGADTYPMAKNIRAVALTRILSDMRK